MCSVSTETYFLGALRSKIVCVSVLILYNYFIFRIYFSFNHPYSTFCTDLIQIFNTLKALYTVCYRRGCWGERVALREKPSVKSGLDAYRGTAVHLSVSKLTHTVEPNVWLSASLHFSSLVHSSRRNLSDKHTCTAIFTPSASPFPNRSLISRAYG